MGFVDDTWVLCSVVKFSSRGRYSRRGLKVMLSPVCVGKNRSTVHDANPDSPAGCRWYRFNRWRFGEVHESAGQWETGFED